MVHVCCVMSSESLMGTLYFAEKVFTSSFFLSTFKNSVGVENERWRNKSVAVYLQLSTSRTNDQGIERTLVFDCLSTLKTCDILATYIRSSLIINYCLSTWNIHCKLHLPTFGLRDYLRRHVYPIFTPFPVPSFVQSSVFSCTFQCLYVTDSKVIIAITIFKHFTS